MYYKRTEDGGYEKTRERPDPEVLRGIRRELKGKRGTKHSPGDGWHYIPGRADILFNGDYWFGHRPSSEGAVLAHVEELCELYSIDFDGLQREAYPDEAPQHPRVASRLALARHATKEDTRLVLNDLTDINYHSLAAILSQKTGVN